MRGMIKILMIGILAFSVSNSVIKADETITTTSELPFTLTIEQSIQSDYVWRGFNLGDDGVYQGSGEINWWELTFNIWYNYDFDTEDLNEVDYTVIWSHTWPMWEELLWTDFGYIFYDFPNTGLEETQEFYFGIGADVFLSPTFSLYHDFDELDGTYFAFGISYSFDLHEYVILDVYSDLGIVNDYGVDDGFAHWQFGASIPWSWEVLNGTLTVAPNLDVSVSLDDDVNDDEVWGGVTASLSW